MLAAGGRFGRLFFFLDRCSRRLRTHTQKKCQLRLTRARRPGRATPARPAARRAANLARPRSATPRVAWRHRLRRPRPRPSCSARGRSRSRSWRRRRRACRCTPSSRASGQTPPRSRDAQCATLRRRRRRRRSSGRRRRWRRQRSSLAPRCLRSAPRGRRWRSGRARRSQSWRDCATSFPS